MFTEFLLQTSQETQTSVRTDLQTYELSCALFLGHSSLCSARHSGLQGN